METHTHDTFIYDFIYLFMDVSPFSTVHDVNDLEMDKHQGTGKGR